LVEMTTYRLKLDLTMDSTSGRFFRVKLLAVQQVSVPGAVPVPGRAA